MLIAPDSYGDTLTAVEAAAAIAAGWNRVRPGDHLIVDKLAYAPHGSLGGRVLPYSEVKHGDIIVFRWPVDIKETYVKRAIGLPGALSVP